MQCKYKYLCASVTITALAAAVTWTLTRSSANQAAPNLAGKPALLPIAQVVLFNSGVGYVQREGEVTGDARVELTFPTSDVNDLLKSLVLQDTAGGRIGAVSYDSQDPAEKILRSFALDLNQNPTYAQILNQARGEKIDVMRQEKPGATPHKVTGTIIGIESHRQAVEKETVEIEQLNLLSGDGMLNIPLAQVLSVRFLSQTLDDEFRRALQVLAGSHDVQKKTVALQFSGNGKRVVKVGYVLERPIWKTAYRLVLEPNGKLFMQGWAIVENTSDDDWSNIRMVLVSGKPISFRMDLYQPLYIPRPVVEPELFASLRPPVYGGSFGGDVSGEKERIMRDLVGDPEKILLRTEVNSDAIATNPFGGLRAKGGKIAPGGGFGGGAGGFGGAGAIKPPHMPSWTAPFFLRAMTEVIGKEQHTAQADDRGMQDLMRSTSMPRDCSRAFVVFV